MAFTAITPAKLIAADLPTASTVLYSAPASTRVMLKDIDICNTTAASLYVTVLLGTKTLIPTVTVVRNGYYQWTGAQILNPGDTISAYASAAGAVIHASGGECT
jgi:hypothetical protein